MKTLIFMLCLGLMLPVMARQVQSVPLIEGATSTGASRHYIPNGVKRTYQVIASSEAGSEAVEVDIEVSNDCVNFEDIDDDPVSLTLTASNTVYFGGKVSDSAWKCVRANVNSISASSSVSVFLGDSLE